MASRDTSHFLFRASNTLYFANYDYWPDKTRKSYHGGNWVKWSEVIARNERDGIVCPTLFAEGVNLLLSKISVLRVVVATLTPY